MTLESPEDVKVQKCFLKPISLQLYGWSSLPAGKKVVFTYASPLYQFPPWAC